MANAENKPAGGKVISLFSKKSESTVPARKGDAKKPVKKDAGKPAKRGPLRYIRDVWQELKKVTWPTRRELIRAVIAVVCFVLAFTVIIWLMDLAVTPGFQWLIS